MVSYGKAKYSLMKKDYFCTNSADGSFIYYVRKILRKSNMSYPGVRNVSFSENFADTLNEWFLTNELNSLRVNVPIYLKALQHLLQRIQKQW